MNIYLLLFIVLLGHPYQLLCDVKRLQNSYISFSFFANLDSLNYKVFFLEKSNVPDYISRAYNSKIILSHEFDNKLYACLEKAILNHQNLNKSRLPSDEYYPLIEKYLDSTAISYAKPLKKDFQGSEISIYIFDIDNDGFQDILIRDIDRSTKYQCYQVYVYDPASKKYTLKKRFFHDSFFLGYDSSFRYIYTWRFNGSRYNTTLEKNVVQDKQLKKVESVFYKNGIQKGKLVNP